LEPVLDEHGNQKKDRKKKNNLYKCGFKVLVDGKLVKCPKGSKMKTTKFDIEHHIRLHHGNNEDKAEA
jgi:hypothetical protein